MGPATPGLVPLLLLLAPYLNSASVIGRGDAHSLLRDACPAGSETCPEFGSAPAAALKYLVCGATKNVILVTVGLVDHPRLKGTVTCACFSNCG
ncbi:hypothetical protein V5799_026818 [Amblyomma americanum]|uniref:Secreted protein n=1 Tax=Amblyomma americanum TaxID=6943 RepID=A0AAQ4DHH6_AMBAM